MTNVKNFIAYGIIILVAVITGVAIGSVYVSNIIPSVDTSSLTEATLRDEEGEIERLYNDAISGRKTSFSAIELYQIGEYKLKNTDYTYFVNALKSRKLANRSINAQMQNLKYNVEVFEQIEKEYFSLDYFITALKPAAVAVLFASTESPYKLKQMKFALVLEYLRNVGIDTAKPDVHIVRILKRLGLLNKSGNEEKQVINFLENISLETGISVAKIDFLLWHYCSENFCNICSANPKCNECVIKEFCNKEEICL